MATVTDARKLTDAGQGTYPSTLSVLAFTPLRNLTFCAVCAQVNNPGKYTRVTLDEVGNGAAAEGASKEPAPSATSAAATAAATSAASFASADFFFFSLDLTFRAC